MIPLIAVIGGGLAGLTAAYTLSDHAEIVIFEKSRGVSGRAATRWYDRPAGRVYVDHGAQYLKLDVNPEDSTLRDLFLHTLPTSDLVPIEFPVWTFDAHNKISQGDAVHNALPKWSYGAGLAHLGKLMVEAKGLTVRSQVRLQKIEQIQKANRIPQFVLTDTENRTLGTFDHVLLTPPSIQSADILNASSFLSNVRPQQNRLETLLRAATYRRCLSAILGYDHSLMAQPYSALLNIDRQHPIAWVGLEHSKARHMPAGCSALVVQMGAPYSLAHYDEDKQALLQDITQLTAELLGEEVRTPDWSDLQKWRYSQPDVLADPAQLNGVVPGLWFAGDYMRGGRIHLAAESGHLVAQQILVSL